jgi:hypothetical protein
MQERPPIWRWAANILNKQSRTTDKGWSSSLGLGEMLTTPHRKNVRCDEIYRKNQTWTDPVAQDRKRWQAHVNAVMNLQVP